MREYPSIPGPSGGHHEMCYGFHKYDGSSMRAEWSRKRGWYKFGLRHTMLDTSDPIFGQIVPIFLGKYADDLDKLFRNDKYFRGCQSVIVFGEFFGTKSFGGMHFPDEDQQWDVVIFDINPHKKGILGPKEFLDLVGHLQVAELVWQGNFGNLLIEQVRKELIDISSKYPVRAEIPEGIVCKSGTGHRLWRCKIKTERYREALKERYRSDWINYWEN